MKITLFKEKRILSIFPAANGFAYALINDSGRPVDWDKTYVLNDKNANTLRKVAGLLERYQPDVIVLEDCAGAGSRRSARVQELVDDIASLAMRQRIRIKCYSRAMIRDCFSDACVKNKHDIALHIAKRFPQFKRVLPPVRKCWMPEDLRMAIFDAVALGLTHFHFERRTKRAA